MTGSLQVKNDKFYIIINLKENGKRKQKWIATGLEVKGNKRKAEQLLEFSERHRFRQRLLVPGQNLLRGF